MLTITDCLAIARQQIEPKRPAIISENYVQDYGSFLDEIDGLSEAFIHYGMKKGEVVIFVLKDSPFLLKAILAVAKVGGIFLGISPKYPLKEINRLISLTKTRLMIVEKVLYNELRKNISKEVTLTISEEIQLQGNPLLSLTKDRKPGENDPCGVLLTSGTTGKNKGIIHSHKNFILTGENCAATWNITSEDRLISIIPLLSAATLGAVVIPALLKGAAIIITGKRKDYLGYLRHNATFIMGNPTHFNILSDKTEGNYSQVFRRGTIAGAHVPKGLLEKIKNKKKISLYSHYGMTELLAMTTVSKYDEDSVGKAFPGISIRIEDENGTILNVGKKGNVVAKSPSQFIGMLGKRGNQEKSWFKTEDIGYFNEEGNLILLGRKGHCINRGGILFIPKKLNLLQVNIRI